MKIMHKI